MGGTLNGKTAIVTGSGRGIGRAIALGLAAEGAAVLITARSEDEVMAVVSEIELAGGEARGIVADVSRPADVQAMVDDAHKAWGHIDILVNNAGVGGPQGLIQDLDLADVRQTLDINLLGPFICCQAVVPHMIRQGRGNIINVSSGAGQRKPRQKVRSLPYQVSKFGLEGLTNAMAIQLGDDGINVNSLLPGPIVTKLHERTPQETLSGLGSKLGQPEDIVPAAVYLAALKPGELTDQAFNARTFVKQVGQDD